MSNKTHIDSGKRRYDAIIRAVGDFTVESYYLGTRPHAVTVEYEHGIKCKNCHGMMTSTHYFNNPIYRCKGKLIKKSERWRGGGPV